MAKLNCFQTGLRSEEKAMCRKKVLNELPTYWVFLFTGLTSLLAIASIVIQIASMALESYFYYVGTGIWAGVLIILIQAITLYMVKSRNYQLFMLTNILQPMTSILSAALLIIGSLTLATGHHNGNNEFVWVAVLFIILGLVTRLPSVFYNLMINMMINNEYKRYAKMKNVQKSKKEDSETVEAPQDTLDEKPLPSFIFVNPVEDRAKVEENRPQVVQESQPETTPKTSRPASTNETSSRSSSRAFMNKVYPEQQLITPKLNKFFILRGVLIVSLHLLFSLAIILVSYFA